MFNNIYKDKKVLITGHTGFKGSWLSMWLIKLGAHVIGVSKDIPTNPSMFEALDLSSKIKHYNEDIRNINQLREIILNEKPDFIFHLAAQAIVSTSYIDPIDTFTSNVNGTMNLLEILRHYQEKCVVILITSDKCYDNVEWIWGYKETDMIGGKDIYSGSKGAAELVIKSYFNSFFQKEHPVRLAIGRAGNVIGGGDWAKDRIVVDSILAWNNNKKVEIRNPKSTRPWQHVLEPLSGYLALGEQLCENLIFNGEPFNFGPKAEQNRTVVDLLTDLGKFWGFTNDNKAFQITGEVPFHEASLLKLNCDKALFHLKWESTLHYEETISFVSKWYYAFYKEKVNIYDYTQLQIDNYEKLAFERNKKWTLIQK